MSVTGMVVPFEMLSGYDITETGLADGAGATGDGVTVAILGESRVAAGDEATAVGGYDWNGLAADAQPAATTTMTRHAAAMEMR